MTSRIVSMTGTFIALTTIEALPPEWSEPIDIGRPDGIRPVAAVIQLQEADNTEWVGVPLASGEVLVVTSWSASTSSFDPIGVGIPCVWLRNSNGRLDGLVAPAGTSPQHHFWPGIPFERNAEGLSDSFVDLGCRGRFLRMTIGLQAYITTPQSDSAAADFDGDGDVDLADFVTFQSEFTGAR